MTMRWLVAGLVLSPLLAWAGPPCSPPGLSRMTFPPGWTEEQKDEERAKIVSRAAELARSGSPEASLIARDQLEQNLGVDEHGLRACEARVPGWARPGHRGRAK